MADESKNVTMQTEARRPIVHFTRIRIQFAIISALLLLNWPNLAAEAPGQRLSSVERLETEHLKAVHQARLRFGRERVKLPASGVFEDYRAVIHVHAEDSDHTHGTRDEVLEAARKTGVKAVLFTDHRGPKTETWQGVRAGVLFIAGSEDSNGVLRFPDPTPSDGHDDELRFLSHIEERFDAATSGLIGMEIVNRHTDAKLDKALTGSLLLTAADPERWRKLVENFQKYPDEIFAAGSDYHSKIFAKWDSETEQKAFTGIAANDAHQNQRLQGTLFDPYDVSFRNLSTHILARELSDPEIRRALRDGNVYVSHDWLCDPTGFAFGAVNNLGVFPMGDSVLKLNGTRVVGITPLAAKLKLIHKGRLVHETSGTNLVFSAKEAGAYRLEAWLTVDGEERPWIYSNPVYLREPTLADVRMPTLEPSTNVETRRDIAYLAREAGDENKHKLDLYIPKENKPAPVFVFFHGGAWKSGDRALYPALGHRFARAGVLTVVPSYRLAPQHRYPAQIQDAAAAFAWVAAHIAEHGGDTNRLFVGGQSAGGHLAALLALNERYLKEQGSSTRQIRGVIAVSGVYDLTLGESMESVFGREPALRRDASPLSQIRVPAPPFLVTYCQWDYPTLPLQARQFHGGLRKAGIPSELVFTPRENHISEVIAMTRDDDVTSRAMLRFINSLGQP